MKDDKKSEPKAEPKTEKPPLKPGIYMPRDARKELEALGVRKEVVEHVVDDAMEMAVQFAMFIDDVVSARFEAGRCVHPQSLSIAIAYMAEKFLSSRFEGTGFESNLLDPVATIGAMKKFIEIPEPAEESNDVGEKPESPTIH